MNFCQVIYDLIEAASHEIRKLHLNDRLKFFNGQSQAGSLSRWLRREEGLELFQPFQLSCLKTI